MQKVTYLNKFGVLCIRHGKLTKEGDNYILSPLDTTKKIIIPKNKYKGATLVEDIKGDEPT